MGKNSGQIQRIQSIYLLLAALVTASLFALPFASAPAEGTGILQDGSFDINDHIGLMVLTVLVLLITAGSIFLYNNRNLQMNLGKLNIVLAIGLVAFAGYLFTTIQTTASIGGGLFVPVIAIILVFVANVNIKKDEKQVRSADRLRD